MKRALLLYALIITTLVNINAQTPKKKPIRMAIFIGNIKKAVIHDGHQGPKEIGCDQFFLDWLTDPVQNGGGAFDVISGKVKMTKYDPYSLENMLVVKILDAARESARTGKTVWIDK